MVRKMFYRCSVLLFPLMMAIFFGAYIFNYCPVKMKELSIFVLMFAYWICYGMFYITYFGNKFGIYEVTELIYSNFLALFISNVIFGLILMVIAQSIHGFTNLAVFSILQFIFMCFWVVFCNKMHLRIYGSHRILVVSGDKEASDILRKKLENRKKRFYVKEIVYEAEGIDHVFERLEEYRTILAIHVSGNMINTLTHYCFQEGKQFFTVPQIPEIIRRGMNTVHIIDTPLYSSKKYPITIEQAFAKRFFDILVSGIATIVLSPFMLVTALAIKLQDGGPVFYKQKRLTQGGKEFDVLKFRSMIVDAEKNSGARLSSGENDSRITKVGKIIRAIRFDELPQLLNILKGDMSIVGPRPERPEIAEQYYKDLPEFEYRLKVKAGLTGYAQVFGKYNTTPKDKLKLDLMYINNYSFYQDLKICFYTVKILFLKDSTEGIEEGKTTAA